MSLSRFPGSASVNNFYSTAMIPCTTAAAEEANGTCSVNIDGACIRGGTLIGGTSGYSLASAGFPHTQCAAFPLFAAGNKRYTQMGWDTTNNLNPLRISRPMM